MNFPFGAVSTYVNMCRLRRKNSAVDSLALSLLSPIRTEYLPWTSSSIRPAAICVVLNDIMINRRHAVVEFGSGISTILMSDIIAKQGGQIVSFDHNAEWLSIMHEILKARGTAQFTTLVHAPLTPCALARHNLDWYDLTVIEKALKRTKIQLLLVDGPEAYQKATAMSRYPALLAIQSKLDSNFSIYLDDLDRKGERKIYEYWRRRLGKGIQSNVEYGFIGRLTKGTHFNVSL